VVGARPAAARTALEAGARPTKERPTARTTAKATARLRAKGRAAARFGLLRLQQGPAQRLSRHWNPRLALLGVLLRQQALKVQTQKSLQGVVLEVAELEAVDAAEGANTARGNDKRLLYELVAQVHEERADHSSRCAATCSNARHDAHGKVGVGDKISMTNGSFFWRSMNALGKLQTL